MRSRIQCKAERFCTDLPTGSCILLLLAAVLLLATGPVQAQSSDEDLYSFNFGEHSPAVAGLAVARAQRF